MRLALLTNDDGYWAGGLAALRRALDGEYETMVVASSRQRSWIGKALTNPGPLTVDEREVDGKQIFIVNDGTPADCVNLGMYHLATRKPDVVISGINHGANFTNSLALASGTVGGALEAALNGVLGMAVSLALDVETENALREETVAEQERLFEPAAEAVKLFLREWFERPANPQVKLINLIVPQTISEPRQFVECVPLAYEYGSVFVKRGDAFYNRGRGFIDADAANVEASDVAVVGQGRIAYTLYTGNLERASNVESRTV